MKKKYMRILRMLLNMLKILLKERKNPKLKRIKNVPKSESYRITSFGLKFIKFL